MKPIKLVINNFGPYKGYNEVDFSSFTSNLFVISGPTGSGKTFIFDAISYALYSKTSTDRRDVESLKCIYASKEDSSYVEFTFEINKNIYFVHKEPYQEVKKRKGSGTRIVPKSGLLKINDKLIDDKIGEVDKKIKAAIGLDYSDFKMTVMVAQGQFYELINADTNKRKEIFRKILKTQYIDTFIDLIKDKYFSIKNEIINKENEIVTNMRNIETLSDSLNEYLKEKDISFELKKDEIYKEISLLEKETEKVKNNQIELNKKIDEAKQLRKDYLKKNEDKNDYLLANVKLTELEKNKEYIDKISSLVNNYDKCHNIISTYNLYIEKDEAIKNNELNISHKKELLIELKNQKEEMDKNYNSFLSSFELNNSSFNEEISNLKNEKKLFIEYKDNENKLAYFKKANQQYESIINEKQKELDNKNNQLLEIKKLIVDTDYSLIKEKYEASLKNEEINETNLNNIEKKINNLLNLNKEIVSLKNEFSNAGNEALHYTNYLAELRQKYYLIQLAEISSNLKENEPCPLCGSLHHPNLYHGENIDKSEIEKAEDEYNKKREKFAKAKTQYEDKLNLSISLTEEIKKDINYTANDFISHFSNLKQINKENIKQLKNSIDQIKIDISSQDKYKDDINVLEKEINNLKQDKNNLENEIKNNLEKIDLIKIDDNLSLKFKDKELSSFDDEINIISSKQKDLKNKFDEVNNSLNDLSNKINSLNNEINYLNSNSESYVVERNKFYNQYLLLLNSSSYSTIEEINKVMIDIETKEEYEKQIKEYNVQLLLLKNKIKEYKDNKIDEYEIKDLSIIDNEISYLETQFDEVNNQYNHYYSMVNNNKKMINNISTIYKDNKEIINTSNKYKKLYLTSSGDITSRNKINFEVYYQSLIFDEILILASMKFFKMTNGRYKMVKSSSFSKKSQSGLDIDVLDFYSGEYRSASTLSGGETFQASLSLALSLAEIIQTKSGGIELNSMFIDEGFGTLDKENLELTKKTLLEVAKSSSRIIGIISHVEDIEKSIPNKLLIEKTENGSHIKQIKG